MQKQYYVYVYYDQDIPVYVGKGKGRRAWDHITNKSHNADFNVFIDRCKESGVKLSPKVVFKTFDELEAFAHERALIQLYGRLNIETGSLFNKNDGILNYTLAQRLKRDRNLVAVISKKVEQLLGSYIKDRRVGAKRYIQDHACRTFRRENSGAINRVTRAAKHLVTVGQDWKTLEGARLAKVAEGIKKQQQARNLVS